MATQFNFKSATPVTSGLSDSGYFFGASSQGATDPSIYQNVALRTLLLGTATSSLAIAAGKTLTANNSITLAGTDATTMTFPSTSATVAGLGIAQTFTTTQTFVPATSVSPIIAGSSTSATQWQLRSSATSSSYPVPTFRPNTTNSVLAFDLMPNGTADSGGFITWIDVCDKDVIDGSSDVNCAHMSVTTGDIQIGARKFGSPSVTKDVNFISPAQFTFTRNSQTYGRLADLGGFSTLWIGPNITPSASNFTVAVAGGNAYFTAATGNTVYLGDCATTPFAVTASTVKIATGASFGFTSGASSSALDTIITRDSANTFAQRNGTSAQSLRWYYSFTDASNYQRGALNSGSAYQEIATETAGSGADDVDLRLTPAGNGRVDFNNADSAAAAQVGTLTNAPTAGNPTFWITVKVNGTALAIPAWALP